jgi:hypothetical protein
MPYGTTPPSQRFRPIGFSLTGGPITGTADLVIRPEELTWTEPTRLTVHQTLAGAWADAFDRGVATIRLSGHTGWHGGSPTSGFSGEAAFANLRQTVFQGWNDSRAQLVAGGQDPAAVELIFTDELDRRSALVAPKTFTLRRHKSRPLLMMYNIELLVLADAGQPTGGGTDAFGGLLGNFAAGAQSLLGTAQGIAGLLGAPANITGLIGTAQSLFGTAQGIAGSAQGALNAIQSGSVQGTVTSVQSVATGLTSLTGLFG